jgi:hypothetical protein
MNLFNCYQAVAFYTATPFAIQWLASNGHEPWSWILGIGELIGFILLGQAINEGLK